jgi:hypothetical protein
MATMYDKILNFAGGPRTGGSKLPPRSKTTPQALTPQNVIDPNTGEFIGGVNDPGRSRPLGDGSTVNPAGTVMGDGTTIGAGGKPAPADQEDPITTQEKARRQIQQELDTQEKKRPRGRAANILTGGTGLLTEPSIARRTLLGA